MPFDDTEERATRPVPKPGPSRAGVFFNCAVAGVAAVVLAMLAQFGWLMLPPETQDAARPILALAVVIGVPVLGLAAWCGMFRAP